VARFVVRRLAGMVVVLFAISVLVFLTFNVIPNGDPAARIAGRTSTPEEIASIRHDWGFDRGLVVQYLSTMRKVFTGDLVSYYNGLNVGEEIKRGFPRTLALALGAAVIRMTFAVVLGLYGAVHAGRVSDRLLTALAIVGISIPVYWLGALLSYYLGFKWGAFPNGGDVELSKDPLGWAWHLILPWAVLAPLFIGLYSRILSGNLLDTMSEVSSAPPARRDCPSVGSLSGTCCATPLVPVVTLWGTAYHRAEVEAARSSPRKSSTCTGLASTLPRRSIGWTYRPCSQ
jgi:peptide/nickel transport system permease protein